MCKALVSKSAWLVPLLVFAACDVASVDSHTSEAVADPSLSVPSAKGNPIVGAKSDTPTEASGNTPKGNPAVQAPNNPPEPSVSVTPPADPVSSCPADMIAIDGGFCPKAEQNCVEWMEDPVKYPYARCAAFEKQSHCKGDRVNMRFCIDRLEQSEASGIPVGDVSWTDASLACKSQGKRLCQEQEWLFACEGEEMVPYPYGYVRNPEICNFELKDGLVTNGGDLADHRQLVTSNPKCVSPFGVQNMVGNIDEWVVLDKPHYSQKNGGRKMMSGLKGGWWGPLRNRCRPTTVDHDEHFHELQTGFRCCADAK